MSLVSSNVANAETPGYVRKTIDQVTTNSGSVGTGVRVYGVNRQLDEYIQAQVRTETSGASYATLKSDFLQQLQSIYGNPDDTGTLENALNGLTTAVQALATSPDSQSARLGVLNAAQVMAQQLNSMTQGIQSMRNSCEIGLDDSVTSANNLMKQIATINNNLQANPLGGTSTDAATAALLDQRDQYITELSELMDIRVTFNSANQVTIFTPDGRAIGRQRGRAPGIQRARHGDAEHRVQYHRLEEHARRGHDQLLQWRVDRPDQQHQVRQDRRLCRTARQDAGRGADPDRSIRRVDCRARCRTRPRWARIFRRRRQFAPAIKLDLAGLKAGNTLLVYLYRSRQRQPENDHGGSRR